MKFTLAWLREHLDTDAPLDALAATLSAIGLEVEGIEDRGAALAPFRVARVLAAEAHPDADRLRACTVDAGEGPVSVVCGAPNARAGMMAVFAPPGSVIPATGTVLKVGRIRGVESAGMLLSAREMGLGDDHAGIVELPDGAPVGAPYAAWAGLDDPVVEIAVTPDRGDALGVRGVARDLAAAGLGVLRPWAPAPVPVAAGLAPVAWAVEDPAGCPWILGRTLRVARNGDGPEWVRARLLAAGLRPINALVDVTNLMALDLGRPLHVFDADKIAGGMLTVRRGRAGERFDGLHGRPVAVDPDDLVIADARGARSLAGVVGGTETGCDAGTTRVFVECALFDPVAVARAGRRHGIHSDARARFERGLDPALPPAALEAATRLMLDHCGGGEAGPVVAAGTEPAWRRRAALRFERLRTLGGADVPPDEAAAILERLGFGTVARDAERLVVAVPSWRNDVAAPSPLDPAPGLDPARAAAAATGRDATEAEADLVEEVLRIRGLDTVPAIGLPPAGTLPAPALSAPQARAALARRVLAARGHQEAVTFAFLDGPTADLFGGAPEGLRLLNPIAADLDRMRPTPLATLAVAAARNAARGHPDVALAELGGAWTDAGPGGQALVAAGIRTGHTPRHPLEPARPLDALDAKGDALAVLAALGVPEAALSVTADPPAHYHPGRGGVVRQGPKVVLARFGALHPAVAAALGLAGPAVGFEVFLDAVPDPKRRRRAALDLPAFQPIRRDFAFLVDAAVPAEALLRAARGADRTLLAEVALFDRYAGERVPAGLVSVGLQATLQPRERTPTDAEIEAVCERIAGAVAKATGAVLRG